MRYLLRSLVVLSVVLASIGVTATAVPAMPRSVQSTDAADSVSTPDDWLTIQSSDVAEFSDELVDWPVSVVHAGDDVPPILAPLLGYSRSDGSDPLDHETRRAIYETVVSTPAIHLAGIADSIDVPVSTVTYHSRVLDAEGLLDIHRMRGRTRLYPVSIAASSPVLDAALAEESTAAVLLAVRRLEPASVRTLAGELDRASSTVSHHLGRLEDDGLVTRERDGEAVVTSLVPAVRETLTERN